MRKVVPSIIRHASHFEGGGRRPATASLTKYPSISIPVGQTCFHPTPRWPAIVRTPLDRLRSVVSLVFSRTQHGERLFTPSPLVKDIFPGSASDASSAASVDASIGILRLTLSLGSFGSVELADINPTDSTKILGLISSIGGFWGECTGFLHMLLPCSKLVTSVTLYRVLSRRIPQT